MRAQRDQQRHRVADRRAVGDIAAQRARVAHRHTGEALRERPELRPLFDQCRESSGERHSCADGDVAVVALDALQFNDLRQVEHLVELPVLLGHPESGVGAASDELGLGIRCAGGEQLVQCSWHPISGAGCQCRGPCESFDRPGANGLEAPELPCQRRFIHRDRRQLLHLLRRVEDRTVAGAAAQVPRQFLLRQLTRHVTAPNNMVLVHAEHAHHEAGRAEAALRAVAADHRFLGRVQRAVGAGEVFHGPQRHAVDRMREPDAAVDGAVADAVARDFVR